MEYVSEKLRQQLDLMSTGFPASSSGIGLKILRQLFEMNETEPFLHLSHLPMSVKRQYLPPVNSMELFTDIAERRVEQYS